LFFYFFVSPARQREIKAGPLIHSSFGPGAAAVPGDDAVPIGQTNADSLPFIGTVQARFFRIQAAGLKNSGNLSFKRPLSRCRFFIWTASKSLFNPLFLCLCHGYYQKSKGN
jgi:hypothetical protein